TRATKLNASHVCTSDVRAREGVARGVSGGRRCVRRWERYQRRASKRTTAASTSRCSLSCPRGTTTYVRRRKRTSTLRGTSNSAFPSGEERVRATKSPRGDDQGHTLPSPIPAGSSSPVTSSSRAKDQLTVSPLEVSAWKSTCTAYGSAGS